MTEALIRCAVWLIFLAAIAIFATGCTSRAEQREQVLCAQRYEPETLDYEFCTRALRADRVNNQAARVGTASGLYNMGSAGLAAPPASPWAPTAPSMLRR